MITFRAYNVILPKFRIEDEITGSMGSIYKAFGSLDLQEDEYLVGIGLANATEVRNVFEQLIKMGFTYSESNEASDDFVVLAKEGIWWAAPWLVYNDTGCWFIADVEAPTENTTYK